MEHKVFAKSIDWLKAVVVVTCCERNKVIAVINTLKLRKTTAFHLVLSHCTVIAETRQMLVAETDICRRLG